MLSLILALTIAQQTPASPIVQSVEPTDDVWVYQYAQDQAADPFLRAWGSSEEGAVGKNFTDHMGFSYSCLKFELPKPPEKMHLKGAKLVLLHAGDPGWDPADAKKHPLEARALPVRFEEESWTYETAAKVHPSDDPNTIYGTGYAAPPDDKSFPIEIDLMTGKGDFGSDYKKAVADPDRVICIALTTSLVPDGAGENTIYKLFSRNNSPELRPKLLLNFGE